jgi:hypothetical protein
MNTSVSERTLKNAERVARLVMIVTLLAAGISKFCSHGKFVEYYSHAFAAEKLRIHLPAWLTKDEPTGMRAPFRRRARRRASGRKIREVSSCGRVNRDAIVRE